MRVRARGKVGLHFITGIKETQNGTRAARTRARITSTLTQQIKDAGSPSRAPFEFLRSTEGRQRISPRLIDAAHDGDELGAALAAQPLQLGQTHVGLDVLRLAVAEEAEVAPEVGKRDFVHPRECRERRLASYVVCGAVRRHNGPHGHGALLRAAALRASTCQIRGGLWPWPAQAARGDCTGAGV